MGRHSTGVPPLSVQLALDRVGQCGQRGVGGKGGQGGIQDLPRFHDSALGGQAAGEVGFPVRVHAGRKAAKERLGFRGPPQP